MNPETRFYKHLKTILPQDWFLQRIETTTGVGIPDLNVLIPHLGDFWAELKYSPMTSVKLRKEQYAWLKKRQYLGGKACVINKDKKGAIGIWTKFEVQQAGQRYLKLSNAPSALYPTTTNFKEIPTFLENWIDV